MRFSLSTLGCAALMGSVLLVACSEASDAPPPIEIPATGQLPEGHPPVQAPGGMGAVDGPTGVVLETMDSGGYTYALLAMDGEEIWTAGPVTALTVGDTVVVADAMGMQDFTSNTLQRTFDRILFVAAFAAPGGGSGAAGSGTFNGNTGLVKETMNSGGYTYVLVEIEGQTLWIAGPELEVAVGQTVGWMDGMFMQNFTSNTLERTFEAIFFANRLTVVN